MVFLTGGWKEGIPSRDLRAYLALAGPPQERTEALQVLSLRLRFEAGQRVCQPLPLRESSLPWDW